MTFDQYLNRPVYLVQCKTWDKAREMNLCVVGFRALPGKRDKYAQLARDLVAMSIKLDRAEKTWLRIKGVGPGNHGYSSCNSHRNQGRKPLKSGEKTVIVSMRMTSAQREKLGRLGGAKWVRNWIDSAKEPNAGIERR